MPPLVSLIVPVMVPVNDWAERIDGHTRSTAKNAIRIRRMTVPPGPADYRRYDEAAQSFLFGRLATAYSWRAPAKGELHGRLDPGFQVRGAVDCRSEEVRSDRGGDACARDR